MPAETTTPFDELRRQFDTLGLQHKAEFLVEASFRTFAAGVEAAGDALSRELDHLFASMNRAAEEAEREDGPRVADEPAAAAPGAPRRKGGAAPGAAEGASPPPADL